MYASTNQWVTCPQCRTSFDPASGGCPKCQAVQPVRAPATCVRCGRKRVREGRFCDGCGAPLDLPEHLRAGGSFSNRREPSDFNECPQCHVNVPLDATRCPGCKNLLSSLRELYGTPFTGDLFLCPACKARLPAISLYCDSCGTRQERPRIIARERNLLARPSAVFWRQLGAGLLDHCIVFLFMGLCVSLWSSLCGALLFAYSIEGPDLLISMAWFFGTWAFLLVPYPYYYIVTMTRMKGQTFAGRLFGVRVIRENGYRLRYTVSALRFAGLALCWITLGIGFLMAAIRTDGKSLADLVAGTRVIEDRKVR